MGTSFVEHLPKSCLLFAFSPTKLQRLLAKSTTFIASVFKKYPKVTRFVKIQTFDSLAKTSFT